MLDPIFPTMQPIYYYSKTLLVSKIASEVVIFSLIEKSTDVVKKKLIII